MENTELNSNSVTNDTVTSEDRSPETIEDGASKTKTQKLKPRMIRSDVTCRAVISCLVTLFLATTTATTTPPTTTSPTTPPTTSPTTSPTTPPTTPLGPIHLHVSTRECRRNFRFSCSTSRECIPPEWTCDGRADCADGSDEDSSLCPCDWKSELECEGGECVALSRECDGIPDCAGSPATDEYECVSCTDDHFRCPGSQRCVPQSWRCDGYLDCTGGADEENCNCTGPTVKCSDGYCIEISQWCDGLIDCRDGSDEPLGCDGSCPPDGERCPVDGTCMSRGMFCDGVQDCPDRRDEKNCDCMANEYQCEDSICISREFLCDGTKDCLSGEDEELPSCNRCTASQLQCALGPATNSTPCIVLEERCDGIKQCEDGSDEANCLYNGASNMSVGGSASQPLTVTYRGITDAHICSDNWNKTWSDLVCHQLGFEGSSGTSVNLSMISEKLILSLESGANIETQNIFSVLTNVSTCVSQQVVGVACRRAECGVRHVTSDTGRFVVNGFDAARGAWPWQVQLYMTSPNPNYEVLCGGSIINERWILTAAHCVAQGPENISGVQVRAGTLKDISAADDINDPDLQLLHGSAIYIHSQFEDSESRNLFMNDLAMIRLSKPVRYSDVIRPICLPDAHVDLGAFKYCVATGFGFLRGETAQEPKVLQEGRMQLMTEESCREAYEAFLFDKWNATQDDFNHMICAGNNPPFNGVDICIGDNGGPLACMDYRNVWTQVGVTSFGFTDSCDMSVFVKVSSYHDWIQSVIEYGDSLSQTDPVPGDFIYYDL